jgi:hypothetical protein
MAAEETHSSINRRHFGAADKPLTIDTYSKRIVVNIV